MILLLILLSKYIWNFFEFLTIILINFIDNLKVANYPQPKYISRNNLSEKMIEKEKELLLKIIMEKEGDEINAELLDKKVEGRLKKFFIDNVLYDQPFCLEDDNKLTIEKLIHRESRKLGCGITIKNMCCYNLGESIAST